MKFNLSKQTQKKNYFPGIIPCSSTLNFFQPAPVFFYECVPGSTFRVNIQQKVRTSVLNLPTWGDYKILTKSVFVPFGDVYRPWDSLMSKTRYHGTTSFIPSTVPVFRSIDLLNSLVNTVGYGSVSTLCDISFYDKTGNYIHLDDTDFTYMPLYVSNNYGIDVLWSSNRDVQSGDTLYIRKGRDIFLGTVDDSLQAANVPASVKTKYSGAKIYISFSEQAKTLYRVYVGLGMPLNSSLSVTYSALPLMCYCKAVFDLFSPERTDSSAMPFESTPLYGLIYKCMSSDAIQLIPHDLKALNQMILDNTYYINNDFYSLFRKQAATSQTESVRLPQNNSETNPIVQSTLFSSQENQTNFSTNPNITSDRLKAIFRIGELIKQNTLIGGKIREFMRSRFGASMSDPHELFEIDSFITDMDISDIFATASSSGDDGSVLGEYGGRALGSGSTSYTFSTDRSGCYFVISVAIQNRYYFDGINPSVLRKSTNDFYNSVYDSLGYEIAPYSYYHTPYSEVSEADDSSFAYMPRYSNYKFFKPVVSGDFSLKSKQDSILGFVGSAYKSLNVKTRLSYTMEMNKPAFYPSLYNTNHIFYEHEQPIERPYTSGNKAALDCIYPAISDPFVLHSYIKIDMHAPMIGRSDVFETSDGDSPKLSVEY